MSKVKLGVKNCLYPLPTTLVGANVGGKPNYIAIAHVGVMALKHVSLSMNKRHYTNAGIRANESFSVNLPPVEMVESGELLAGMVAEETIASRLLGQARVTADVHTNTLIIVAEPPVHQLYKELIEELAEAEFVGKFPMDIWEAEFLINGKFEYVFKFSKRGVKDTVIATYSDGDLKWNAVGKEHLGILYKYRRWLRIGTERGNIYLPTHACQEIECPHSKIQGIQGIIVWNGDHWVADFQLPYEKRVIRTQIDYCPWCGMRLPE